MPSYHFTTAKIIASTALITLLITVLTFLILQRIFKRRKRIDNSSFRREEATVTYEDFEKFRGKVKGLIVDENGKEVVYMRKLEDGQLQPTFPKMVFNPSFEQQQEHEDNNTINKAVDKPEQSPPIVVQPPTPSPPRPPLPPLRPPVKRNVNPPPLPPKRDKDGEMKLKPLHWDKVQTDNVDHSVVWNEIKDGSLRVDDELIENLFGYTNNSSIKPFSNRNSVSIRPNSAKNTSTAQVFILEPRKSQNTAIVLKSLIVSRNEIIESVLEGQGLSSEVLEKLAKVSPTQDESNKILQFNGDPAKLADAESFLYEILRSVPSAFVRIKAMLFRSNYDSEILNLKESLEVLELGCKELRTRGLFLKLLEAILKAGNKMNAGTSRGDAEGFKLSALGKLTDVKSTDGKTTLLHFVVEQVIKSEGRRRHNKRNSNSDSEHLMLGLEAVTGLRDEFTNVKKAAGIEYETFKKICSGLSSHVDEIKQVVEECGDRGGFKREMEGFLVKCEEEVRVVGEEEVRVMEVVKRTTEYYQAGGSMERCGHPFQIFGIVKDFLEMVDRVCGDISRNLEKNVTRSSSGPVAVTSPLGSSSVRFQNFRNVYAETKTSSSDSDDSF